MSIEAIVQEWFLNGGTPVERQFIVYLLGQMEKYLTQLSDEEFLDVVENNPDLFFNSPIDVRSSAINVALLNMMKTINEFAADQTESNFYPLIENHYDIYFICRELYHNPVVTLYQQIVPPFPYQNSRSVQLDMSRFYSTLGPHSVDSSFNLGLTEYLMAVDPNTGSRIRSLVEQYFSTVPGNHTLTFIDLYNYLIQLPHR